MISFDCLVLSQILIDMVHLLTYRKLRDLKLSPQGIKPFRPLDAPSDLKIV
jgi:hypothetical protein